MTLFDPPADAAPADGNLFGCELPRISDDEPDQIASEEQDDLSEPAAVAEPREQIAGVGLEIEDAISQEFEDNGGFLFDGLDDAWKLEWIGMPEYTHEDQRAWKTLFVHFVCKEDFDAFCQHCGLDIYDTTRFTWYPPVETLVLRDKRWIDDPERTR